MRVRLWTVELCSRIICNSYQLGMMVRSPTLMYSWECVKNQSYGTVGRDGRQDL